MEHFNWSDWIVSAGNVLLASIGGLLGYSMREHDKGNPFSWSRAAMEGVSSGFVGFLVMLLCGALKIDPLYSGFIVGVFGWLGANASIRLLEGFVYKKLGIKMRANTDKRYGGGEDA